MFSLATHGNNQGIDALFFKVRVVNRWRFKTVRWIADVGDQLCVAVNVHDLEVKMRSLKTR